ncbi:MAG: FmdB family transcriptional regulator [Dehalococcoidia bacterium]|nr:FmdB family transcriptional regulator [Dehalococcoidia bacterium]HCV00785.1 FmdB family transcriptional regulator [Dehalococcoidia bacterium]
MAGRNHVPTYEYHCDSCKRRYDLREGFDAPTSHSCNRCKKGTATRVLHAPTVVFKGSGFYVNDSRKSEKSTSSSSSDKTVSLPSSDSGKKGESKGKSAKSSSSSSKD